MIGYLIVAVLFFGGIYASYTDIKIREVSNLLSFGMLFAVLGLRLIDGFYFGNFENIKISLMVGGIFLALGTAFFYAQQWGGADVKLLTALGIGLGTLPEEFLPLSTAPWPFFLTLLLDFFIVSVVFALLFSVSKALKNEKVFSDTKKSIKKYDILALGIAFVLFAFGFAEKILLVIALIPVMPILSKFLKSVEKNCMLLRKNVGALVEFDIPERDIKVGEFFVSSKDPNGMTPAQIKTIQGLAAKGKLPKFMKVKWGAPLVPVFPITILVALFVGDLMYLILKGIAV